MDQLIRNLISQFFVLRATRAIAVSVLVSAWKTAKPVFDQSCTVLSAMRGHTCAA